MNRKKRSGADTCCFRCQVRATCSSKVRQPCSVVGGSGSPECAEFRVTGWCLVCPSFKGAKPEDKDQMKLFSNPEPGTPGSESRL